MCNIRLLMFVYVWVSSISFEFLFDPFDANIKRYTYNILNRKYIPIIIFLNKLMTANTIERNVIADNIVDISTFWISIDLFNTNFAIYYRIVIIPLKTFLNFFLDNRFLASTHL